MRNPLSRSAPIGVQVILLVLFSVGVAQLANAVVLLASPRPQRAEHAPDRVARLLTGAESSSDFRLARHEDPPHDDYVDADEHAYTEALAAALGQPARNVRAVMMAAPPRPDSGKEKGPPGDAQAGFTAARRLPEGGWQWLEAVPGWFSAWQGRILLWLLLSGLLIAPAALLLARRFIRPVRAFAESAERLGDDPQAEVMAVSGPAEIEEAAASFRRMQMRIGRYVEDRTAMVAAIAHDLRTPLTRLAFRLEALPPAQRDAAMDDIDDMQRMIGAALEFVKGGAGGPRAHVDLTDVLAEAAAGLAHETAAITIASATPAVVMGDRVALQRLLSNLLQNAVRYGERARAGVTTEAGAAIVSIDDDGPGIPVAELEKVFDPFYRLEPSRSRASGGTGLGLAIARAIALDHGGTLTLSNRAEGGLRASFVLPLAERVVTRTH